MSKIEFTRYAPGTRKGNRYWILRGGAVGGRRIEISTKTTDYAACLRFEADLIERISAGELEGGAPAGPVTFACAADIYVAWRSPSKADLAFIRKLKTVIGTKLVTELRQADLVEAALSLYPNAKASTRNRQAIRPAASILHYAADNELCPWLRVKLFREPKAVARSVTVPSATALIEAADDPDLKLLLIVLFGQGYRISEALSLTWEASIDLSERMIRIYASKTGEWRTDPMDPDVLVALANVDEDRRSGPVFRWRTKSGVYPVLRPVAKKIGLKFTPHMARHSMATWLAEAGATTRTLMEAGGWNDVKSVAVYARPNIEYLRKMRAAGGRSGGKND